MTWQDLAACAGAGPSLWFAEDSTDHSTMQAARAVCNECPVRLECLDYALENGELHGMWGGLTPKQRRREALERGMPVMIPREPRPIAHGSPTAMQACRRRNGTACVECRIAYNDARNEARRLYGRNDRRVAS